jgi:hypothetical protein
MITNRLSKSPLPSQKKLFLTQEDSSIFETVKSKKKLELFDPKQEITVLKKNFDTVKQLNIKKEKHLELLQAQLQELKSSALSITSEKERFNDRTVEFEAEIAKADESLLKELELKRVYEHILSRNKVLGTHLDIEVNKYAESVKSAKLKLDFESEKARKAKDSRFSAKSMLKDLKVNLEEDTKKHVNYISNLEKNIEKRRELLKKYDDKSRRQHQIIELAAQFDREKHEKDIREIININKILFDLLIEKEKKYHKAGKEVENAFKDIRNKTGFQDPKEILSVFMNREKTHNKLIEEVEKAEVTLDSIQNEYYQARDKLKSLLVVTDSQQVKEENGKNQISSAYKKLSRSKDQQSKTETVFKDVKKWCKKIQKFLNVDSDSEDVFQNILGIQAAVDSLVLEAQENFQGFRENLVNYQKKRTSELVENIYQESPARSGKKTRKKE